MFNNSFKHFFLLIGFRFSFKTKFSIIADNLNKLSDLRKCNKRVTRGIAILSHDNTIDRLHSRNYI